MVALPLEIIDIIIDHLHKDVPALKACALVCKSWLPSSRFHLFSSLKFRPDPDVFLRWEDTFSSSFIGSPSHLVQSLSLINFCNPETLMPFIDLFRSFSGVQILILNCLLFCGSQYSSFSSYFTHLTKSVRTLELINPIVLSEPGELVRLICMFPNLDNLHITKIKPKGETDANSPIELPITTVPSFRGSLRLTYLGNCLEFVQQFGKLPTNFRKLRLVNLRLRDFPQYNPLLTSCGSTLERLKIQSVYDDREVQIADVPPLNLENNTVLRRLRVTLHEGMGRFPRSVGWLRDLLSTITSPHLSEVKFILWKMKSTDKDSAEWKDIDRILVGLCEKRAGSGFKVVFGVPSKTFCLERGAWYVEQILPNVKKAGALKIVQQMKMDLS